MKWIESKALAATESRFNGAIIWKCIHDLQAAGGRFETGSDNGSHG